MSMSVIRIRFATSNVSLSTSPSSGRTNDVFVAWVDVFFDIIETLLEKLRVNDSESG